MTTPLATVANSIIEFILSLLRDPAAVAELEKDPEAALVKNKVAGICADDVRAVAPIIYDRPDVAPKPTSAHSTPPPPSDNDVVNEITRITNNWTTIDSRATIVDQSVNQNIWTEGGDVSQIFDQGAGVASGDGSVAAGDDNTVGDPIPDDADEEPTLPDLPDLPGVPDLPDAAAPEDPVPAVDDSASIGDTQPAAPVASLAAAEVADGAQEAATVLQATAETVSDAPPPPAYEAPVAEVDEAVWSEPDDTTPVEEIVYPDEFSEEQ
ncbi:MULTISPECIES: IniB N-terminal domain-containing protein [Microbacterium]|uniref:IniB N-terminal domain-containing protein n=1 Tax=Microbacterium TaxID=33882 RepID=UPI000D64420F|nr:MULTISPECIES: IniB N-terminal domain-containing protein [Microbacterium]